jgi:hypothetical protein
MSSKQKSAWRPILGRIQILTNLVKTYGVGGSSGLDHQTILNFLKSLGAFAHSNGEVRDAAKSLCVAVQKFVGEESLLPFLTSELRKKQLEEYQLAFQSPDGDDDSAAGGPRPGGSGAAEPQQQQQPRVAESKLNRNVQTTAEKSFKKDDSKNATVDGHGGKGGPGGGAGGGGAGGEDYTICMFCGKSDATWNEDGLDLHYWKECPLLSPCSACAQIVEIAGLPEHLLDECEQRNEYEPCETTGDSPSLPAPQHTPISSHLSALSPSSFPSLLGHEQVLPFEKMRCQHGSRVPIATHRLRIVCTVRYAWHLWRILTRHGSNICSTAVRKMEDRTPLDEKTNTSLIQSSSSLVTESRSISLSLTTLLVNP